MGVKVARSSGSFHTLSDTIEIYRKKDAKGKNRSSRNDIKSHTFKWWCDNILLYGTTVVRLLEQMLESQNRSG